MIDLSDTGSWSRGPSPRDAQSTGTAVFTPCSQSGRRSGGRARRFARAVARAGGAFLLLWGLSAAQPAKAAGQEREPEASPGVASSGRASIPGGGSLALGVGGGVSLYCIVSRCGSGTVVHFAVQQEVLPSVELEAGVRRHLCFDCDQFWIADGGVRVRTSLGPAAPFGLVGFGVARDPRFMGTRPGPVVAVGASLLPPGRAWGAQLEVRGRRAGRGQHLLEGSVTLVRRFP